MTDNGVAWARPDDRRVEAQFYAWGKIKVRLLKSGIVQYATGEGEWIDADLGPGRRNYGIGCEEAPE